MTDYNKEFPFEQVSRMDSDGDCCGDYANSPHELMELGYAESQIWAVSDGDEEIVQEDGRRLNSIVYGPSGMHINVFGYMATKEHHDGDTFYTEEFLMEPFDYKITNEESTND
jgi:hypothetical protein